MGEGTTCPKCEADLDIDAEDVAEGEIVSCSDCGADLEVVTTEPLELIAVEDGSFYRYTEQEAWDEITIDTARLAAC